MSGDEGLRRDNPVCREAGLWLVPKETRRRYCAHARPGDGQYHAVHVHRDSTLNPAVRDPNPPPSNGLEGVQVLVTGVEAIGHRSHVDVVDPDEVLAGNPLAQATSWERAWGIRLLSTGPLVAS